MIHEIDGVCSKGINFDVENGKLKNVEFYGGCPGNLTALGILLEGMNINEAHDKLKGITCGGRPTSCSDQLAKAIEKYL